MLAAEFGGGEGADDLGGTEGFGWLAGLKEVFEVE